MARSSATSPRRLERLTDLEPPLLDGRSGRAVRSSIQRAELEVLGGLASGHDEGGGLRRAPVVDRCLHRREGHRRARESRTRQHDDGRQACQDRSHQTTHNVLPRGTRSTNRRRIGTSAQGYHEAPLPGSSDASDNWSAQPLSAGYCSPGSGRPSKVPPRWHGRNKAVFISPLFRAIAATDGSPQGLRELRSHYRPKPRRNWRASLLPGFSSRTRRNTFRDSSRSPACQ